MTYTLDIDLRQKRYRVWASGIYGQRRIFLQKEEHVRFQKNDSNGRI